MIKLLRLIKEIKHKKDDLYSWQAPSGKFHPVSPEMYSHGSMAHRMLGKPANTDCVDELWKMHWNRIHHYSDTIYIHNERNRPSKKQIKDVIDLAIETGMHEVVLDTGAEFKIIWSEFDILQEWIQNN
jgi:hypothetical protein